MTTLLVVLILAALYLAFRVHMLQNAIFQLAHTVNKPVRRLRALQKEIKDLEDELESLYDIGRAGALDAEDLDAIDLIREKLDRRLRALAGQREAVSPRTDRPAVQPTNEKPGRETG